MNEIELRIQRLDQLFDSLDPSPFNAKALDRNAESYLLECAGEHGPRQPLAIAIHAPQALRTHVTDITAAIHAHFALAYRQAVRRHRKRRRIGRFALFAGMMILAAALLLRQWVEAIGGSAGEVLAEGLLILAWVALWRPIETIGFESWDCREERRLLQMLSRVPVHFVTADSTDGLA